jgi:hypothetical protein
MEIAARAAAKVEAKGAAGVDATSAARWTISWRRL